MKRLLKISKKTLGKKISKRKTKKTFKKSKGQTKKNLNYGGDIMENTYVKEKIVKYLDGLETSNINTDINESCITPDSKGGQIISICGKYVYKSPPVDAKPFILVKGNVIYVNGYVMNLLIQSIIKKDAELNKRVECYNSLIAIKGRDIFKTLVGKRYQFDFDGEKCFSVESFIKVFNTKYSSNKKTKVVLTLVKWVKTMIETLNLLWNKMQFHHCDPKAAQLFINGDWDSNELIVGDLDKVTFSINIDNQVYRVCLPQYGRETLNENLSSAKNIVKNTFSSISSSPLSLTKKLFGSNKHGGLGSISFAELMRISTTPNPNNHRETAAFISSILLLIDDDEVRETLFNILSNSFSEYTQLIDFDKLLKNHSPFEKRRSHKIACSYIKPLDPSLKPPVLQSQVGI